MAVATQRGIRFHPEGAACRGEAPPRSYVLVVYPHVIDGFGGLDSCAFRRSPLQGSTRKTRSSPRPLAWALLGRPFGAVRGPAQSGGLRSAESQCLETAERSSAPAPGAKEVGSCRN